MATARRALSSFSEKLANPANMVQSYISRSNDPYLNLSIEHHILQKSPPDSVVLFLYTNRPCIVIGRNQNPWTEVNLGILNAATQGGRIPKDTEPPGIGHVDLVRRRSGGGAVFHDEGNVNWSITCPMADFTRDKYAEMVVRALRKLGIERARVNERHDIVLDQGHSKRNADPRDTHRTPYTVDDGTLPKPLKVSGSAYKLTRARALHHATTLLSSPNLHIIPQYLRSPAKPFIQARGVESVSSPVGNIGLEITAFQSRLQEEFASMYSKFGKQAVVEIVGDEHLKIPDIRKGYDELRTKDWMWSQTPQFTLTLHLSDDIAIDVNVHHGVIKAFDPKNGQSSTTTIDKVRSVVLDQKLQDIHDWHEFLKSHTIPWNQESAIIADLLEKFMPVPKLSKV
ncbi:hypothetical protein K504DRAFT_472169 [Pleomassaria siparia CBS 279.74]|uniref:Putative lipoate-protein ligase A n=1 Tax=Pleomassaria siparia CBS 279.74 TaxID=1314801 RepID=A0A6G1JX91_9PLEO|nr:hypothetical protein K504DRAFT_472169 [Pleomassaria siparia CBS 279.74]